MATPKTIADLRPSSYNPRTISQKAKDALHRAYMNYGDLSGIVFNITTGNLIGGHQRTGIFRKNVKSTISKKPTADRHGTVAIGHVEIVTQDKRIIRIPYREVRWNIDKEKAANIAANSSGGEFDQVKLGKILKDLENKKFPIEDIPIDAFELRRAVTSFQSENAKKNNTADPNIAPEFPSFDPDAMEKDLGFCCPRCGLIGDARAFQKRGQKEKTADAQRLTRGSKKTQTKKVAKSRKVPAKKVAKKPTSKVRAKR